MKSKKLYKQVIKQVMK